MSVIIVPWLYDHNGWPHYKTCQPYDNPSPRLNVNPFTLLWVCIINIHIHYIFSLLYTRPTNVWCHQHPPTVPGVLHEEPHSTFLYNVVYNSYIVGSKELNLTKSVCSWFSLGKTMVATIFKFLSHCKKSIAVILSHQSCSTYSYQTKTYN